MTCESFAKKIICKNLSFYHFSIENICQHFVVDTFKASDRLCVHKVNKSVMSMRSWSDSSNDKTQNIIDFTTFQEKVSTNM